MLSRKTSSGESNASLYADYASITNGSYYKLVKAYYEKNGNEKPTNSTLNATTSNMKSQLATIKSDASLVKDASIDLMKQGSKSIFNKKEVLEQSSGTTTMEYNVDKIYGAVKKFTDSYNSMVDSATDSNNQSVLQKTLWLVNGTKTNRNMLSNIGITISSDNKLTIDETNFKKADMNQVKGLFQGQGSLTMNAYEKANDIYNIAYNAINTNNFYTSNAGYSNILTSGNMYDSLF